MLNKSNPETLSHFHKEALRKHNGYSKEKYQEWYNMLPNNKKLQVILLGIAPHEIVSRIAFKN